jgi:hypothetical protein
MKFRLWKKQGKKWAQFSERFDSSDVNSLHYQKAVRLSKTAGWIPYQDLPPVRFKQDGRVIEKAVIVPEMADPMVYPSLDYSNLEKVIKEENGEKETIGKCFSEFIKKQGKREKEQNIPEDSPETKALIAAQALEFWKVKYKNGEFVPTYILRKLI